MNKTLSKRSYILSLVTAAFALCAVVAFAGQSRPAQAQSGDNLIQSAISKLTHDELSAILAFPLAMIDKRDSDCSSSSAPPPQLPVEVYYEILRDHAEMMEPAKFLGPRGEEYESFTAYLGAMAPSLSDWDPGC